MLSPSGLVPVCPGEDLVFVCSTDRSFIEWNVTLILGSGKRISRARLITSSISQVSPLVVQMKTVNITVHGSLPLTSTLTAANVTADLNGTQVSCIAIGGSIEDVSTSSATVHLIEPGMCGFGYSLTDIPRPITCFQCSLRVCMLIVLKSGNGSTDKAV